MAKAIAGAWLFSVAVVFLWKMAEVNGLERVAGLAAVAAAIVATVVALFVLLEPDYNDY